MKMAIQNAFLRLYILAYFALLFFLFDTNFAFQQICFGGRVPKDLYVKQEDGFVNNNSYTEVVIKKGGKLKLNFDCTEPGCYLKWEFRTFENDIRFGIRCKNNDTAELVDEVALKRVASHQLSEIGFIPCQPNCSCMFFFFYTQFFDFIIIKISLFLQILCASTTLTATSKIKKFNTLLDCLHH